MLYPPNQPKLLEWPTSPRGNEFFFEGHRKNRAPWRFHETEGGLREYLLRPRKCHGRAVDSVGFDRWFSMGLSMTSWGNPNSWMVLLWNIRNDHMGLFTSTPIFGNLAFVMKTWVHPQFQWIDHFPIKTAMRFVGTPILGNLHCCFWQSFSRDKCPVSICLF
jgi:hypothetical protein